MKIVVCIKQVGYIYDPTAIDLATGEIDLEKMVSMLNPYDEVAVEEAIKIKESVGDCEVVIVTAGQPDTEKALRYAYAMGGDRMVRIDYEGTDPWKTALILASAIEKTGFDLVLCGKKAIDSNGGQVGSFVAELLRVPQISGIVDLNLFSEEGKVIRSVHDEDNDGRMELTWYYNSNGEAIKGEKDQDGDGKADLWIFHNSSHLRLLEEDTNHDGKVDIWESYDENKHSTLRKRDLDYDGKADIVEEFTK